MLADKEGFKMNNKINIVAYAKETSKSNKIKVFCSKCEGFINEIDLYAKELPYFFKRHVLCKKCIGDDLIE